MPEAEGGTGELDGDEHLVARFEEASSVPRDVGDDLRADRVREKLVQHQPVVMPDGLSARLLERLHAVDGVVMEEQESRGAPPGSRFDRFRGSLIGFAIGGTRNVLVNASALDTQLRAVVQVWGERRAAAVDRLEVERRRPGIGMLRTSAGRPSTELASKVTSWAMNWARNVLPGTDFVLGFCLSGMKR